MTYNVGNPGPGLVQAQVEPSSKLCWRNQLEVIVQVPFLQ